MFLNIDFEDNRVKELFDDLNNIQGSRSLMQGEIGAELTRAVKKRYNQLVAFNSFFALVQSRIGKIEPLSGDLKGSYSITVSANYRLILKPVSEDLNPGNLESCDTLIIKGVVDYHGKGSKNNWIIP